MLKVDKINISNFEGAFRGLRNPMNSWAKNDTRVVIGYLHEENPMFSANCMQPIIGPNDMELAQRMINGGTEESKFMRQIFVSMDIDAPLFWWKEMDTYKVGTVANSCSTMHKITSAPITMDNFSFSPYIEFYPAYEMIIYHCEELRKKYLETKDKRYWRTLIEILPEAWNQKRTWTANYQVLRNIYFQRRYHKLEEWHQFCDVIEKLPYGKELICYEKKEKNNEL
jgi:hypothetical protein